MKKPACGRCNFQGDSRLGRSSAEILCLIDGTWHEDSYSCKHWSEYAPHLSNQQRVQLAIARKNEEDDERRHRETLEHLARRDPPINITLTQTQHQTQVQQQAPPTLPNRKPTSWFLKHIREIVIAGVGTLFGGWLLFYAGPQGPKAGRDIEVSRPKPRIASSPLQSAPVIRVASTKFGIYKPLHPQAPGQTKAQIQVRVVNDSDFYPAQQVHVRFLTDDGLVPKHRADSDEWNAQQGTPSLYTFDLPRRGVAEVPWRPDIPGDSQELYGSGKAKFTLVIHISWEDLEHKKYELLDTFELAYNRELKDFILEKKASYNSFFDSDKIREALAEWSRTR